MMLEDYYFRDPLIIAILKIFFLDLLMKLSVTINSLIVKKVFHLTKKKKKSFTFVVCKL